MTGPRVPPWDPDLDLATGVLTNHLGITDAADLAAAEAAITANALVELQLEPLPGRYDLPHLQEFHRRLFGDIYPFAGRLRTVSLHRAGTVFCPPAELSLRATQVFRGLAVRDGLRGLRRGAFLDALTDFTAALNRLHPFREGNGRSTRAFVAQLARDAGHPISWAALDREQNIAAAKAATAGDPEPLRRLLDGLLER